MRTKSLAVLAVCIFLSNSADGASMDGNTLLAQLEKCPKFQPGQDNFWQTYIDCESAHSYIRGVFDLNLDLQKHMRRYGPEEFEFSCPPANVSKEQLRDVVYYYLKGYSVIRQRPASQLVEAAVLDAWPCPENP